jgi:hypothetical protein
VRVSAFFVYGAGRDVGEAFRCAVERNGGPIAHKPGAILVELPPKTTAHLVQSRLHGAKLALAEIDSQGSVKAVAKDRADLRWLIRAFGSEAAARRLVEQYHSPTGECIAFKLRAVSERRNARMHLGLREGSVFAFLGVAPVVDRDEMEER